MMNVQDIRNEFVKLKANQQYVVDKTGCKMLEIIGATFLANEETIFGAVNLDYVKRELIWYHSQSLNVEDIPGSTPAAWKACASSHGFINSNYGFLIWNEKNHNQYDHVLEELKKNPFSRRAIMVYTRPSIWEEYNTDGMSDFICTNAVQYFVRNEKLVCIVSMRSNDAWAGYRNDVAWQRHVHYLLASDLGIEVGDMIWNAGSLHFYEKQFDLIK